MNEPTEYQPPARRSGQRMDADERALAQAKFLEIYAETGFRAQACLAAGVSPSTLQRWKSDPKFIPGFAEAQEAANEKLRDELEEARKRGLVEVQEEWVGDKLVGKRIIRKQDARVLLGAAQARLPEYKPASKVELTGPGGVALAAVPSLEEAQELLRLVRGARQLGLLSEGPEDGEYRDVESA